MTVLAERCNRCCWLGHWFKMTLSISMRRSVAVAVIGVLAVAQLLMFPNSASADQWSAGLTVPPGSAGVSLVDGYHWNEISDIVANDGTSPIACSAFTASGPCALNNPTTSGTVTTLLPLCESSTATNCVASMSLGATSSTMVSSTYVSTVSGPTTPSDPSLDIPAGSNEELWTNPLENVGETNTYATLVAVVFSVYKGQVLSASIDAAIYPYSQIEGTFHPAFVTSENGTIAVLGGEIDCAYATTTTCGRLEDFPLGTQASLSVRVSNLVGGWFKGRLQDPTISETPFDANSNVITVSAGVVSVPTLSYVATTAEATSNPSVGAFFSDFGFTPGDAFGVYEMTDSPGAFSAINAIRDVVSNTASGEINVWNFGTLPSWSGTAQQKACLNNQSQVDGIVTTNSMAYQPGPPSLQGGFFSYGVAGMHYNADGSLVLGTYDLDIRDSVAECLYGFAKAPISATVSVTESSSDTENVATTTVQDNGGWLHVGAYGFEFSNPTISVKITQSSRFKSSIVCVRDHVTKRVTGFKPVCPRGFKKK
jgi:hypothetical protein